MTPESFVKRSHARFAEIMRDLPMNHTRIADLETIYVVHLPERTEMDVSNYRIRPDCAVRVELQ